MMLVEQSGAFMEFVRYCTKDRDSVLVTIILLVIVFGGFAEIARAMFQRKKD